MDSKSLLEAYEQYYIPHILKALQAVLGHPLNVGTDEALFRQVVSDPGWKSLPLPLRMIDRTEVRWDEYLLAARREVLTNLHGTLGLRQDTPFKLLGVAQRLFAGQGKPAAPAAAPAAPAQLQVASPVAKRASPPPLPPSAQPQAPAPPRAAPPAPARSTLPPTPPTTVPVGRPSAPAPRADDADQQVAVGIDLGTTYRLSGKPGFP